MKYDSGYGIGVSNPPEELMPGEYAVCKKCKNKICVYEMAEKGCNLTDECNCGDKCIDLIKCLLQDDIEKERIRELWG